MFKKIVVSGLVVFILWAVLGFVVNGVILRSAYEATVELWRPMAEMKTGLMYVTMLIQAFAFVCIFGWLTTDKSLSRGIQFGLLYGVAVGIGMGYGTYSVLPIPYRMALTWFLSVLVQATVGGILAALIMKE
jgi:hypothetical protein